MAKAVSLGQGAAGGQGCSTCEGVYVGAEHPTARRRKPAPRGQRTGQVSAPAAGSCGLAPRLPHLPPRRGGAPSRLGRDCKGKGGQGAGRCQESACQVAPQNRASGATPARRRRLQAGFARGSLLQVTVAVELTDRRLSWPGGRQGGGRGGREWAGLAAGMRQPHAHHSRPGGKPRTL